MSKMNISHPEDEDIDLDADIFMRKMLRELTGLLEDVVGDDEAQGFINSVGAAMGEWIDRKYTEKLGAQHLDPEQIASIFVDLKRRIGGDFYIVSVDDEKIVVGNRRCPFGKMAEGRDALCMMTSNVFGRIAADRTGYARVDLCKTIARGDDGCLIVVDLKPDGTRSPDAREYYGIETTPKE